MGRIPNGAVPRIRDRTHWFAITPTRLSIKFSTLVFRIGNTSSVRLMHAVIATGAGIFRKRKFSIFDEFRFRQGGIGQY